MTKTTLSSPVMRNFSLKMPDQNSFSKNIAAVWAFALKQKPAVTAFASFN